MNDKGSKKSVMEKVATFIVDKRNLFFLLYIGMAVFCLFSRNWVKVNNDLTSYLPEDSETRAGLTLMEDEFYTYGSAKVMVSNITFENAEKLETTIGDIEGVKQVTFDETEDHYKNSAALYDITFAGQAQDDVSVDAMKELKKVLKPYDVSISSETGDELSNTLAGEMNIVILIAAVIIVLVLTFTSRTYAEVPVLIVTFGAAALMSMGTNFIFDEISFISDSVTVVLQLALAIDYAIILCHRYSEERETKDAREAVIAALSKAIPEISSSSLTTISGLLALTFMQFKIGFDMGVVLIKAIICSLIAVFTLMPGLLMLASKYIDKTHHKNFVPKITPWGKLVCKLKYVFPPLFVLVIAVGCVLSLKCPYAYGNSTLKTVKQNEQTVAEKKIENTFGTKNLMALIVPAGDYEKEGQLLSELKACKEVDSVTGLAAVEASDDYIITDKLTARQFAEMTDLDVEIIRVLYGAYAVENDSIGQVVGNFDDYGVPLIDMFMFLYDQKEEGYVTLDDELDDKINDLYTQLSDAKLQLQGKDYSRMLVYLNLPEESDETFAFLNTMHEIAARYYDSDKVLLVGDSTSDLDLKSSFAHDNSIISILTALFVIIVLLFTFRSAGLPVLLILVIQGSIWINFSIPFLTHENMFFLSYLIVSSIQMGANIDYAIVISNRFLELKREMPAEKAMIETLNLAFPTIVTSGTILASAGILISYLTSQPAIYAIGKSLGSGTIISMLLVIGVLPQILLLGDKIIERTSFNIKHPELAHSLTGFVRVDGRVRGYVSGVVDAEMHGIISGDVNAIVDINNIKKMDTSQGEIKQLVEGKVEEVQDDEK